MQMTDDWASYRRIAASGRPWIDAIETTRARDITASGSEGAVDGLPLAPLGIQDAGLVAGRTEASSESLPASTAERSEHDGH
jgi:hypothetical protein